MSSHDAVVAAATVAVAVTVEQPATVIEDIPTEGHLPQPGEVAEPHDAKAMAERPGRRRKLQDVEVVVEPHVREAPLHLEGDLVVPQGLAPRLPVHVQRRWRGRRRRRRDADGWAIVGADAPHRVDEPDVADFPGGSPDPQA